MVGSNAYGDPTITISTTRAGVACSSTVNAVVLAANSDRRWALFVNDGTTPIYLAIATSTGTAVKNQGIRLNANGGSFEMSAALGNLDTRTVHGVTALTTGHKVLISSGS